MSRVLLKNDVVLCRKDGSSVKFYIKKCIGSGSSCVVYHAVCEDNTEHLLKEYYPRNLDLERDEAGVLVIAEHKREMFEKGLEHFRSGNERLKEVRLSENLKNFTSNVQGYFYGNGTEYIDMAAFAGRTYSEVKNETLHELMVRMKTLAQVIGYYHDKGLLHLDIKPDNIFVRPEEETAEDVMLFDFDSVIDKSDKVDSRVLSYTKDWAAPEQLLPYKRNYICEATDIFSIGEIIFTKIFGRHSTQAEHRSFAQYDIDYKAEIFNNVNPKVFPLINELFRNTICAMPQRRYQTAAELIAQLDKLVKLSNPETPFIKTSLPLVSGFFTGRGAEIKDIHEKLKKNNLLFICGVGGIGKSELAKHYAKEYEHEYDSIIFAPFVNDIRMMIADDNCVPIYNFSQYPEEKPDEYFARKMRKLGELCDKRTLLIVDNLDTTEDENLDKLFSLGCKMLVTARMDFSDVYPDSQIDLGVLADPLAVFNEYYKRPVSEEEHRCVEEIIEIVCGHTMTVELLAKQMMAGRVKPEKMLEKLKNDGVSGSGKEKIRTSKDGNLSMQSAYGHIQALFDLSALDKDEKHVLANLSLVPHTGIHSELFCELCECDGFDAINSLATEGWIRWDKEKDYIALHPLLAEIILDDMKDSSELELFVRNYFFHIRKRDAGEDRETYLHREDIKINKHFINLIKRYDFSSVIFGMLVSEIGTRLYVFHQWPEAIQACEISIAIAQKNFFDGNLGNRLAMVQNLCQAAFVKSAIGKAKGDYDIIRESIKIYMESIEVFKMVNDDPRIEKTDKIADVIANLYSHAGAAYRDLDEIDCARDMINEAIAVYEKRQCLKSGDYMALGALYNNLGDTYSSFKALKYYLIAKDHYEKAGVMTRNVAITLRNIANIFLCEYGSGEGLDIAAGYAQKVLEFFENECPEDLHMLGESKYMLGAIYSMSGDTDLIKQAYILLNESKEIFSSFLPPEDNNLAVINKLIEKVRIRLTS